MEDGSFKLINPSTSHGANGQILKDLKLVTKVVTLIQLFCCDHMELKAGAIKLIAK